MMKGDILGHEFMGEVVEVGPERQEPARWATAWSCRSPSPAASAVFCERELYSLCDNSQPQRLDGREDVGLLAGGHLRLLAPARRLCRRAGGVRARAVRRRRPAQGAGGADRRAGAVPVRHLPDRLHGGGELRHQAGRHGGGVGLRAGRPVRDQERLHAGRRARDRHRPLPRPPAHGPASTAAPRCSTTRRWTCSTRSRR